MLGGMKILHVVMYLHDFSISASTIVSFGNLQHKSSTSVISLIKYECIKKGVIFKYMTPLVILLDR